MSMITTPPSWQELHDVSIQLRKDYDALHEAYLKQIEVINSARVLLETPRANREWTDQRYAWLDANSREEK
jgi:hypothetical protein